MKFPSIFNKINPQSIQQHPEKNELNWMLELNQWKAERILTGENPSSGMPKRSR
ncbi:T3SS secreted effector EspR [Escherichia coli]|nr:T3SS secreted effector EspR [Escherichia coli]